MTTTQRMAASAARETLVTTKSGTNQFHGSAYFGLHRPALNAFQRAIYNNGVKTGTPQKDTQRFNQYGGSLGGPIWKDKIFAFFAYESSPNGSNSTGTGWYETAAFRAAANTNSIASKFLSFPGAAVSGTIVTTGETCAVVGLVEGTNCRTIAGQGLDIGSPLTTGLRQAGHHRDRYSYQSRESATAWTESPM